MPKDKCICWGPNCKEEIEVSICCSDSRGDCGCRGFPVDPPFCSEECYDAFVAERQGLFEDKPGAKGLNESNTLPGGMDD